MACLFPMESVQKHNEQYAKELQQQYYDLRATCERLDSTLVSAWVKHGHKCL